MVEQIPSFCLPCLERLQTQCSHIHTSFRGGNHFCGGEVWDDIREVCDDCGVILDTLPKANPAPQEDEVIPF